MKSNDTTTKIVRFGIYEVDLRAEELRKNGSKLRRRGQPFQVLTTLLERPGEVVTREELREKLWPHGTFVDFDHSLNTAINKIREVLGDSAENLDFSRDSQWVAYVTYPEATLWRSRVDGSQRQQLSSPPLRAILPRWSPDGKQIVFYATAPGQPMKLYLVSSEGGTPSKLLPGERIEIDPSWSADGHSIVFGRNPWLDPSGAVALHRLDLSTGQLSTLPGSEGLISPLCSPDGRYVSAVPKATDKLLLFDITAQKWTELAQMPINFVNWSRDGKYVYFDIFSRTDPAIFRVRVSDRKVERLMSLKDLRRAFGPYSRWFALAPDDSPVLLRDIGTEEIYALDWEAP